MLIAVVFAALVGLTTLRLGLAHWRAKSARDWVLDVSGLTVQGTLVPVAQRLGLAVALVGLFPGPAGSVVLPGWLAFLGAFVAIDALYYWNHRALHFFWPVHAVHHTVTQMDVLGTSRNTLWSSVFIVYLWSDALALWLLAEPAPWLLGSALTAALDLWRHSPLQPPRAVASLVRGWLILPNDHHRHHASAEVDVNFGANLAVWDRLFGTWRAQAGPISEIGAPTGFSAVRELLWPFGIEQVP